MAVIGALLSGWEALAAGSLTVRHERVRAHVAGVRLLYASDLHFSGPWTERAGAQLVARARELAPDAVLLGGDLADWSNGLARLTACVDELARVAPVLAVAGNHDVLPGVRSVRAAVEAGGGVWLGGRSRAIGGVTIDGGLRPGAAPGVRVLCAHDPDVFERAADAGYDLVLAGHLHGLQWVAAERGGLLYPGALVWRYNGLKFTRGATTMLVSRGVSDTFPLRWNCPREVLACEIGN